MITRFRYSSVSEGNHTNPQQRFCTCNCLVYRLPTTKIKTTTNPFTTRQPVPLLVDNGVSAPYPLNTIKNRKRGVFLVQEKFQKEFRTGKDPIGRL